MRFIKPLLNELRIRKKENYELYISVLQEVEEIKTRNSLEIEFEDDEIYVDEKIIEKIKEKKKKKLKIARKRRKQEYIGSILALMGIVILIIDLIIVINLGYKKSNSMEQNAKVVYSELSENTSEIYDESNVWVSINNGDKYHSKPSCSKMKAPKEISLKQAKESGYTACKKCY